MARRQKTAAKARPARRFVAPSEAATGLQRRLRERTRELNDAHEQLSATTEVLRVISSSPGELPRVFQAILEKSTRICEAKFGNLWLRENDKFRIAAIHGASREYRDFQFRNPPVAPDPRTSMGRIIRTRRAVQVEDVSKAPTYGMKARIATIEIAKARTLLGVPMLKGDDVIGIIGIYRQEVRPFTDKQVTLLTNFAAQAVIAIENARLLDELRQRTDDLTETLDRQTATSEVLRVISSSPGDLEPVFATILQSATHFCQATFAHLFRYEGGAFQTVATYNAPAAFKEFLSRGPIEAGPETPLGRMVLAPRTFHIADARELRLAEFPLYVAGTQLGGIRTLLSVPMIKDNALIGTIQIYRQEVRPFTDKQMQLVTNFAAQAVIAIENARLLNELRESLQQQTATADVLKVISRSKFELQPILQSVVETAMRLCRAEQAVIYRLEDGAYRFAAGHSTVPEYLEIERQTPIVPEPGTVAGRAALTRQIARIDDAWTDPQYEKKGDAKLGGVRSMIGVPLMREGEAIGVIALARNRVEPFVDREIELVATFADQAVIAIENVRLFSELRRRTADLTESLEQQTATSEVLQVISSSPGDLEPVLATMLEKALEICGAKFGHINRWDGETLYLVAERNTPAAYAEIHKHAPRFRPPPEAPLGRMIATKTVAHVADLAAERIYTELRVPIVVAAVELGRVRTVLAVPMLKDDELVGAFILYRDEVRPFSAKQIALVTSFASQAVIAIENTRLLTELRQRTDELARSVGELRALGEVSQAVNSTLDLQTVLSTIVAKAAQLSNTDAGAIYAFDDEQREFHLRATYGMEPDLIEALTHRRIDLGEPNVAAVMARGEPVQVADLREETAASEINRITLQAGYRARLVAPLQRGDGGIVGMLVVRRKTPGAFAQGIVDLMKTFAAQSVLAIQNARLFHEIADKSRQLETASKHKSQFLANMSHELRTPLNAILGYTELILDGIYGDAPEKMRGVLERVQTNGRHLLGLINDVLDMSKIEAGQVALSLSDYSLAELVQGVYVAVEPLASKKNLALSTKVAAGLPRGRGDERRLAQVLLNLVGNAIKFTDRGEVAIEASLADGSFKVAVRDSGPGIAPADQAKIFVEFQQVDSTSTREKGGTGLGLAISKRIVEMHGGRLSVDSEPGKGSTFTIKLPVRAGGEGHQA